MLFRAVLAGAALALLCPALLAASQHTGPLADLTRTLETCPEVGIFDEVRVAVDAGTALLTGRVTSAEKKAAIATRAAAVPGITAVRNHIAVLPASPEDDELRYRIARALYGHPAFWKHASSPNPPIHIIVERGHVTLTGIVETPSEAGLARALASGAGESSLTSRLQVRQDEKLVRRRRHR